MKITEMRNEEALDLLCDILDPTSKIVQDKDLAKAIIDKKSKVECIKIAIKNNKKEIIEILARIKGVPVEKYDANLMQMMSEIFDVLNDKELLDFFTSQRLSEGEKSSSQPMANTEAKKK